MRDLRSSDLRSDPNFPRDAMQEYDSRSQWAAVGVLLVLCAALIVGATFFSGTQTQTAMNTPDLQTVVPATPAAPATPMPAR